MIACCGIFCDACSFRVPCLDRDRRHLLPMPEKYREAKTAPVETGEIPPCPGCGKEEDGECGPCDIKTCFTEKAEQNPSWQTCADCAQFPCRILGDFESDGIPHHRQGVETLRAIRRQGWEFVRRELEKRYTCPACGKRLSWYMTDCPDCQGEGHASPNSQSR